MKNNWIMKSYRCMPLEILKNYFPLMLRWLLGSAGAVAILSGCNVHSGSVSEQRTKSFRLSRMAVLPGADISGAGIPTLFNNSVISWPSQVDYSGQLRWHAVEANGRCGMVDSGAIDFPSWIEVDRGAVFDVSVDPPFAWALIHRYLIRFKIDKGLTGGLRIIYDSSLVLDHPYLSLDITRRTGVAAHAYYGEIVALRDSAEFAIVDLDRMSIRRLLRLGKISALPLTLFQPRRLTTASAELLAVADADAYSIRLYDTLGNLKQTISRTSPEWNTGRGSVDSIAWANRDLPPKNMIELLRPFAYDRQAIHCIGFVSDSMLLVVSSSGKSHEGGILDGKPRFIFDLWKINKSNGILIEPIYSDIESVSPDLKDHIGEGISWPVNDEALIDGNKLLVLENANLCGLDNHTIDEAFNAVQSRVAGGDRRRTLLILTIPGL